MKLPEVSTYRFVSEDIANLALRELTQALAGNLKFKDGHALYPVVRIDTGAPANADFVIPPEAQPIQNLTVAQTLAALLIRAKGIEIPDKVAGDLASQLIIQLALYGATRLGGQWLPLIQAAFSAVGVSAPSSIPAAMVGAIKESLMAISVTDVEIARAIGKTALLVADKLEAAHSVASAGGAAITPAERDDIIESAAIEVLSGTIGPDIAGFDKIVSVVKAALGFLLPLIEHQAEPVKS
jgi:hypothetical protein